MGLTDKGYQRRTYDDILTDKINRAKELFGEDIDTSDQTPLGKYIRINAYDQAQVEETLEAVYYARFPNTATGQSLDRLLVYGGITRNPASAAVYSVKVEGAPSHLIEVGFEVGTDTDITFYSTQDATIGEDGTCMIDVECTEPGTMGNVNAAAINKVINPDANISAVQGVECLETGADEESDVVLRERLKAAISGAGSGNENAIRGALLRVPTVQYAAVVANETNATDADGRPPHSIECYVLGGDDYEQEIAEAIFEKRPIGIATTGSKSVTVIDASGNEKVIKYSPAPNVPVSVRMTLKITPSYPEDGAARIYSNIAGYINGLGIGTSLAFSALYGYIYSVPGVAEVVTLEISTDGSTYGTSNVVVPTYGVAICAAVNVEVTE